ncbi:uncharacterized protein ACNS7B_013730 [Menidia menidia]
MHSGRPSKSQLFDSLEVYLNDKKRLQPIIGLSSIVECVGAQNREALFLCEVCVCRLNKADMRNHILGSLHRFSYIKAFYPHFLPKWPDNSDLSKLAWPLMELAKVLEAKEGPGDVQYLEVEDVVYQRMATQRENQAVNLIYNLRDEMGESESFPETAALHHPIQSERTVLLKQSQQSDPETSPEADGKSYKILTRISRFPPLPPEDVAFWAESQVCSESESASSFLYDDSGAGPFVGLGHLVELRSGDGHSFGFLCHCCRIKSNKEDISDHLTSISHITNYLIETQSDEFDLIGEDIQDNYQLLHLLAEKVEQKEGRREPQVVKVPESHIWQFTGKSYHWCLKMLSGGFRPKTIQNKTNTIKGPSVNKISVRCFPGRRPVGIPRQRVKPKKKRAMKTNTVFSVSLPSPKGSMLLLRTSFSGQNHHESCTSPSSDVGPVSLLHPEMGDGDTASSEVYPTEDDTFEPQNFQFQQDFYQEDGGAGDPFPGGHVTVTASQHTGGYGAFFHEAQDPNGTEDQCRDWKYERQQGSHHQWSNGLGHNWRNEDAQWQSEEQPQDWPSLRSRPPGGAGEQWFSSAPLNGEAAPQSGYWSREWNYTDSDAVHQYSQHHPSQQACWADPRRPPGAMWWRYGAPGGAAPHSAAAPEAVHPALNFQKTRPGEWQRSSQSTVNHFQMCLRDHVTHQGAPPPNGVSGPASSPETLCYPVSNGNGLRVMQAHGFLPPERAACYGGSYF